MASDTSENLEIRQFCSECGRPFAASELVRFGDASVCGECKTPYVQRLREGVAAPGVMIYGGFWRRVVAVFIDSILVAMVVYPLNLALAMIVPLRARAGMDPFSALWVAFWSWGTLMSYVLEMVYSVYFISQRGATLGKMLMGLKVVTSTGAPVSVGRAFGRFFARYVSVLTLYIGFIIAAFDDQKRALHDYICSTRVIRD